MLEATLEARALLCLKREYSAPCCVPLLEMKSNSRFRDLFNSTTDVVTSNHAFVQQSIRETIKHLLHPVMHPCVDGRDG